MSSSVSPRQINSVGKRPRTAILMCHGLATELHLNLQIKVIAGCDKNPLLRQLFIRHNKTCKFSYGEMREMIRDILNDPSKIEELKNVDIMSFTCPCQGRSVYCVLKTTTYLLAQNTRKTSYFYYNWISLSCCNQENGTSHEIVRSSIRFFIRAANIASRSLMMVA